MDMPRISKCDALECAYNKDRKCHALAITVGDIKAHPMCDTFTAMKEKGGDDSSMGHVGACRVSDCQYNMSLECQADSIDVGAHKRKDWDCQTYEKREGKRGQKQEW